MLGVRVLLWDLDPQGAATFFFRVKPYVDGGAKRLIGAKGSLVANIHATDHPGLDLVPADFSLRHLDLRLDDAKRPTRRLARLLEPLSNRYDLAILDCPPGITLTSESVFSAADALLVPTIPTPLSKRTLDQLSEFLADHPAPPADPAVRVDRGSAQEARNARSPTRSPPAAAASCRPPFRTRARSSGWASNKRLSPRTHRTSPAAIAYRHLWSDVVAAPLELEHVPPAQPRAGVTRPLSRWRAGAQRWAGRAAR